jgi:DNA-binding response OmpR family regulator
MSVIRRRLTDAPCAIIVDDDPDARQMYCEYLRLKGWTAFSAGDGRVGLNKTMELTPHVVVLDLAMPKVDGWTVLKQLRESSMTAQTVVLVVSAMPDTRDAALAAGADAYLAKPCAPDVLYLQLRALMRLRDAELI